MCFRPSPVKQNDIDQKTCQTCGMPIDENTDTCLYCGDPVPQEKNDFQIDTVPTRIIQDYAL